METIANRELRVSRRRFVSRRVRWSLYVMVLPAFLLTCLFSYTPMIGILIAFQEYQLGDEFLRSRWVGLEQFRNMFAYPDSIQVLWNTLVIACSKLIAGLVVPIVFALLLNEVRRNAFKRTVQTLVYLPHFLSWVVLAGIMIDLLNPDGGLLNRLVVWLGGKPVFFLGDGDWFRFTVVVSHVWKEFGYSTIIYLAALAAVNPDLYEAAEVDGASRFSQCLHVTLPSMLPIIIVCSTLSLGGILDGGFDQIYNLYNPLVYSKGDIIDTFVYRTGLQQSQFSFATAMGLFKGVITFVLTAAAYRIAYRYANYTIF